MKYKNIYRHIDTNTWAYRHPPVTILYLSLEMSRRGQNRETFVINKVFKKVWYLKYSFRASSKAGVNIFTLGVGEVGQVEVGQDWCDWSVNLCL